MSYKLKTSEENILKEVEGYLLNNQIKYWDQLKDLGIDVVISESEEITIIFSEVSKYAFKGPVTIDTLRSGVKKLVYKNIPLIAPASCKDKELYAACLKSFIDGELNRSEFAKIVNKTKKALYTELHRLGFTGDVVKHLSKENKGISNKEKWWRDKFKEWEKEGIYWNFYRERDGSIDSDFIVTSDATLWSVKGCKSFTNSKTNSGYLEVKNHQLVHRVVMRAFWEISDYDDHGIREADHVLPNKDDNGLLNIQPLTKKQNIIKSNSVVDVYEINGWKDYPLRFTNKKNIEYFTGVSWYDLERGITKDGRFMIISKIDDIEIKKDFKDKITPFKSITVC